MKTVMKRWKPGLFVLVSCLCIGLIVCTTGCQKKEAAPVADGNDPAPAQLETPAQPAQPAETAVASPDATPETAPTPEPEPEPTVDPNQPVVTINGDVVTEGQLGAVVDAQLRRAGPQMANIPPMYLEQMKKQMRQRVLDMMVSERLLDQQIAKANIVVTDDDVISSITEMGAQRTPPMTIEQFKEAIEAQGGNFDEAKEQYRKGLARQKFMETQWVGKIDVNDADAQAYYDAKPAEFTQEEKVKASHILVKFPESEAGADPNLGKVAARAKITKLLGEVKDGGDFAEIAKANSDCPSSQKGGDLGFFAKGQMVPPFADAAFAMQPGDTSDIVETRFGYHIIRVTDRQEASVTPFDEAKAGIVDRLTRDKKTEVAQAFLDKIKSEATIEYAEGQAPPAPPAPPTAVRPAVRPAPEPADANDQ